MKHAAKRLFSLLLALVLVVGLIPGTGSAAVSITGSWQTDLTMSAADLGVSAPDSVLRATLTFTADGHVTADWEAVDLTAFRIFFHDMFVNAYYAMGYGAGITDFAQIEQFCIDSTGMGVSAYMDTLVTDEAMVAAFTPASTRGLYMVDGSSVYLDMDLMGITSDPEIPNPITREGNTLYLNAASYGKSDFTFVCQGIDVAPEESEPEELPTDPTEVPPPITEPEELPTDPTEVPPTVTDPEELPTDPTEVPPPITEPEELPTDPTEVPPPVTDPEELPTDPTEVPPPITEPEELPTDPTEVPPTIAPEPTEPAVSLIASGNCGNTITWTFDSTGTLTIHGTGVIPDFEKSARNQPWNRYMSAITALVIENGITRIGDRAFQNAYALESAVIGGSVESIGEWAFQNCYELTQVEMQPDVILENGAFRSTPVEQEINAADSALYSGSRYYLALSQTALTGNYREDIVNVALSQIGYHEGDSAADYAGNNPNGSGNYTEYGRSLGSIGAEWCSEFASWCARKAGVPTQILANSRSANVENFTENTSAAYYTWEQTIWGGGSYTPRKGDILLWAWDMDSYDPDENLSHTSILLDISEQPDGHILLNTIDGNSENQVKECSRQVRAADGSLTQRTGRLYYIIAPNYEG